MNPKDTIIIPVEKNIPIPTPSRRGRVPWYPWAALEVGDSFAIEWVRYPPTTIIDREKYRHPDRKFTYRRTGKDSFRIWRIA